MTNYLSLQQHTSNGQVHFRKMSDLSFKPKLENVIKVQLMWY